MPTLNTFPTAKPQSQLKVPQVRVLVALMPDEGDEPPPGTISRRNLAIAAGPIPTSGTMSKVLNGIQNPESSTGKQCDGLFQYGYIERVDVDLDGQVVDSYRITRAGLAAVREWLANNTLPPKRDEKMSTNRRYTSDD